MGACFSPHPCLAFPRSHSCSPFTITHFYVTPAHRERNKSALYKTGACEELSWQRALLRVTWGHGSSFVFSARCSHHSTSQPTRLSLCLSFPSRGLRFHKRRGSFLFVSGAFACRRTVSQFHCQWLVPLRREVPVCTWPRGASARTTAPKVQN